MFIFNFYLTNHDIIRTQLLNYKGKIMSIFSNLQNKLKNLSKRSKSKEMKFNLDRQWLTDKLLNNHCEVTGLKFSHKYGPYYPSIDRIDSSKGYTKDNCKMVCCMYNAAKCEHPVTVFENLAKTFVKKYEENN